MYRFLSGEQTVLVMDCLGLTRWGAPDKVKTDRDYTFGQEGSLSISEDSTAVAYRGEWCSTARFELPGLKKLASYERFRVPHAFACPGGQHLFHASSFTLDTRLVVSTLAGEARSAWNLRELAAPAITLSLGEEQPRTIFPRFEVSAQHHFGLHDATSGVLFFGYLEPQTLTPTLHWRCTLRVPKDSIGRFWPSPSGLVLATFLPASGSCRIDHISPAGTSRELAAFSSIGLPAVSARWLAWQPSPDEIVRQDRQSGALERFSIAEVTAAAHRKKNPRPAWLASVDSAGLGEILLGEERIAFLPWHRETFLDLQTPAEIFRKLPEAEYLTRHLLLSHLESIRLTRAREGRTCALGSVTIRKNNISFNIHGTGPGGSHIANHLSGLLRQNNIHCGSYGYW